MFAVYNVFDYSEFDTQTNTITTEPCVFVATVVQEYFGNSVLHIIRGIEIATADQGKLAKSEESLATNGGKYKISSLYEYVKSVPRENGGLKYNFQEELDYKFQYTKTDDGEQYSVRNTSGMTEAEIQNANSVISRLRQTAIGSKYLEDYVGLSTDRMRRVISDSVYKGKLDTTKNYIAWIDPTDFVYATTTRTETRQHISEEAGTLDIERFRSEMQPIYALKIKAVSFCIEMDSSPWYNSFN